MLNNFIKSKTDLKFPKKFKIKFEFEDVPMEKVVPLFKPFPIKFELGKALFGSNQI
jgi:hypothetical protein